MKKTIKYLSLATLLFLMIAGLTNCYKAYMIRISTNDIWFNTAAGTQTLDITSNCKWTITKSKEVDWYTIDQMSGQNDATITITVKAMEGVDYRGSKFVISSPGGHVRRTVFVSQNKMDFSGLVNKVFGLTYLEHWNTDFYDQIIEDEYEAYEYDPYDSTRGQRMYFFENGVGIQRRVRGTDDSVFYYPFEYAYYSDSNIFHIVFELADGGYETYDSHVLCASDSLYRVFHEYKPHWFERADMRKIGTIHSTERAILQQKVTKRKKGEPIFISE